jgi:hypothetical protein
MRLLRVVEIEDYPHALNGLQIENSGEVTRIGAAVDASGHTLRMAVERDLICSWSTTDCSGLGCSGSQVRTIAH